MEPVTLHTDLLQLPFDSFCERMARTLSERKRIHIPNPGELVPCAVLMLIERIDGEYRFVLIKRSEHTPTHQGDVSFPGGRREGNERPVETALRETREEIGLTREVTLLGLFDECPTISRFHIVPVVAAIDGPSRWTPDPREVDTVIEPPLARFLDRSYFTEKVIPLKGIPVPFYAYTWREHYIWGMTAAIIQRFMGEVFGRYLGDHRGGDDPRFGNAGHVDPGAELPGVQR